MEVRSEQLGTSRAGVGLFYITATTEESSPMSLALSLTLLLAGWLAALPDPIRPAPKSPRRIAAVDSVFIEELTWMEVRDAMKAGKDTVIVATGGVEQNGPYLVTCQNTVVLLGPG